MRHAVGMRYAHILFYAAEGGEALCADYNRIRREATPLKLIAHSP